jgi:hypothetical protein
MTKRFESERAEELPRAFVFRVGDDR